MWPWLRAATHLLLKNGIENDSPRWPHNRWTIVCHRCRPENQCWCVNVLSKLQATGSRQMATASMFIYYISVRQLAAKYIYVFLLFGFSTGLVRHYIAGLPLRSCPDPWATFCGGVPQCLIFVSSSIRIRTHVLVITMQMCYRYANLTPISYKLTASSLPLFYQFISIIRLFKCMVHNACTMPALCTVCLFTIWGVKIG